MGCNRRGLHKLLKFCQQQRRERLSGSVTAFFCAEGIFATNRRRFKLTCAPAGMTKNCDRVSPSFILGGAVFGAIEMGFVQSVLFGPQWPHVLGDLQSSLDPQPLHKLNSKTSCANAQLPDLAA